MSHFHSGLWWVEAPNDFAVNVATSTKVIEGFLASGRLTIRSSSGATGRAFVAAVLVCVMDTSRP